MSLKSINVKWLNVIKTVQSVVDKKEYVESIVDEVENTLLGEQPVQQDIIIKLAVINTYLNNYVRELEDMVDSPNLKKIETIAKNLDQLNDDLTDIVKLYNLNINTIDGGASLQPITFASSFSIKKIRPLWKPPRKLSGKRNSQSLRISLTKRKNRANRSL